MVALMIATLSTNLAANVVSPANGFSNIAPRRISFRTGALITCFIGVVIMPWRLVTDLEDYIFTWLIGYGALLGPIAGIMLCDYFIVRRTELDVDDLYDPKGQYAGANWAAIAALILGVLPNLPGFVNAATNTAGTPDAIFDTLFDTIYSYGWFIGLPLAAGFYLLFMLVRTTPGTAQAPPRTS